MLPGNGALGAESRGYREVTRRLIAALGPTLVAGLAGSRDRSAPHEWAKADGPEPSPEALPRLACAYEVWLKVAEAEGDDVARAWFVGGNPRLSDDTPVTAIRKASAGGRHCCGGHGGRHVY